MAIMKALRFHGKGDLRLEEIAVPSCGAGQVKVAPKFCGICGSDLHEYLGGANLIPKDGEPHAITGETLPIVMGHEFSGVVEEVGEGVTKVKKGDHVAIYPLISDGDCNSCELGLDNCCDKNGFVGLSGWGGGMAEFLVVPERLVEPLLPNVSLELGALVEPLAVGWHAVVISPFKETDTVLVLGGGPIGLAVVQVLAARGCRNIIVSEISSKRQRFAQDFGAHHVINPSKVDIVQEVRKLSNGRGADLAFDAAGVQVGLDTALKAIRARGTLVNIAIWEKRATLEMNDLVFRERVYMGTATYSHDDFKEVIKAISTGILKPQKMITKLINIDDVEEEGFKALIHDKENQVKILIDIGNSK